MPTVAACLLNVRLALRLLNVPTVHGENVAAGRLLRCITSKLISIPQVLNGHQLVLLSLNKYLHQIDNNDTDMRQLFDNGLNALKSDALLNDNGYNYSFYDRLGGLAKGYHKTHIINFQKLYDITGDIEWLKIKKVFEE